MTALALALVLVSALTHSTWNLLTKRVAASAPFLWLVVTCSFLIYAPFAIGLLVLTGTGITAQQAGFMAVNGALNALYFALLARGYRAGDLSLVYPVARGTGPLLATIGAVLILGERPTPLAVAGGLAVIGGGLILVGDPRSLRRRGAGAAAGYALLTGVTIAAYTLWDKVAVSTLFVAPLVYECFSNVARSACLFPAAIRRPAEILREWRTHRREVLLVAALGSFSYILVLTALATSPVSYVAPVREIGMLFGTLMGVRLLSEGFARRRVLGAAAMVAGVFALAVG